jgi:hypothetical protein
LLVVSVDEVRDEFAFVTLLMVSPDTAAAMLPSGRRTRALGCWSSSRMPNRWTSGLESPPGTISVSQFRGVSFK